MEASVGGGGGHVLLCVRVCDCLAPPEKKEHKVSRFQSPSVFFDDDDVVLASL